MKMIINMPDVAECKVSECAYNMDSVCNARAITIGDSVHPGCDTFLNSTRHAKSNGQMAGVGACKVAGCMHNEDFECIAQHIQVAHVGDSINCLTYTAG